ncbi:hypothetical protein M8C21_021545, partial [Ambrosia artemisiifolia]
MYAIGGSANPTILSQGNRFLAPDNRFSKEGLKSELEKASPSLGRSAVYLKDSHINGLPKYLTIQFVRFFWKRESNQKAKIL